jgi:hypothetical protein
MKTFPMKCSQPRFLTKRFFIPLVAFMLLFVALPFILHTLDPDIIEKDTALIFMGAGMVVLFLFVIIGNIYIIWVGCTIEVSEQGVRVILKRFNFMNPNREEFFDFKRHFKFQERSERRFFFYYLRDANRTIKLEAKGFIPAHYGKNDELRDLIDHYTDYKSE